MCQLGTALHTHTRTTTKRKTHPQSAKLNERQIYEANAKKQRAMEIVRETDVPKTHTKDVRRAEREGVVLRVRAKRARHAFLEF